jgi:hypothetical protein
MSPSSAILHPPRHLTTGTTLSQSGSSLGNLCGRGGANRHFMNIETRLLKRHGFLLLPISEFEIPQNRRSCVMKWVGGRDIV